ncbi:hypothetical protein D3C71_2030480 [compost metagenome]
MQIRHQREGQQGAEQVDGAVNDQAVGKGDRRIGNALAATEDLRQPVKVLVNAMKKYV